MIAEYTGKKPRQGGAHGWLWLWRGRSRSRRYGTGGSPYAPVPRQAHPPRHAVWYAPGDPSGGTGHGATWIGQHPIPPSGARQRGRLPPPEPSAFPQMAPVDAHHPKRGSALAQVAREVYGVSNPAIFAWIKQNNPHLQNVNRLKVGMQLTFPPLPSGWGCSRGR